jgi:hypothetical protein
VMTMGVNLGRQVVEFGIASDPGYEPHQRSHRR